MTSRNLLCGLVLLLAGSGGACRTTRTSQPAGLHESTIRQAALKQSWSVHAGAELCGYVQRFETDEVPPRFFFHVQNLERQDLGMIDSQGRAWRYRPHAREADWVATGTVAAAVAAILGWDGPVELRARTERDG